MIAQIRELHRMLCGDDIYFRIKNFTPTIPTLDKTCYLDFKTDLTKPVLTAVMTAGISV